MRKSGRGFCQGAVELKEEGGRGASKEEKVRIKKWNYGRKNKCLEIKVEWRGRNEEGAQRKNGRFGGKSEGVGGRIRVGEERYRSGGRDIGMEKGERAVDREG